ncbi:MAG: peptidase M28, partial [Kiritimatiellia bacterium]|nr:peptidase M28 [Kiritimatiellia bacterium]
AVAGPWHQGDWIKSVKIGMKGATDLPVYSIRAPSAVPGIDFSDHLNYWPHGFKAIMITDTAFYRNRAYHTPADRADSLDYKRMAKVVIALHKALHTL